MKTTYTIKMGMFYDQPISGLGPGCYHPQDFDLKGNFFL